MLYGLGELKAAGDPDPVSNLRRFAVDPSAEARRPSEIEAGVEEELLEQLNDAENPGEEGLSTSCRTRDRNYSIRMQI